MRRLWQQIAQTTGANGAYVAASAVVLLLTTRVLGPEGRGAYAVLTGWVLFFSMLGSLSLGQIAMHRVTERPGRESLAAVLGACLLICGAIAAASWLAVAVGYWTMGASLFRHLL